MTSLSTMLHSILISTGRGFSLSLSLLSTLGFSLSLSILSTLGFSLAKTDFVAKFDVSTTVAPF